MNEKDWNAFVRFSNCVCVQKSLILGVVEEIKQGRENALAFAKVNKAASGVAPKGVWWEKIVQP